MDAIPQLDLEIRGLRKRYGAFTAVDGVSLAVARGQFVCLLGPSGCGKTTTLRCVAGLDEPIGALDYSLREAVMIELKEVQRRAGISFVWVTHDQNEAFSLGDHVVVMNHARIEQQGPPEEILRRPRTAFVAGFVQGNNVFRGRVTGLLDGLLRVETAAGAFLVPARWRTARRGCTCGTRGRRTWNTIRRSGTSSWRRSHSLSLRGGRGPG